MDLYRQVARALARSVLVPGLAFATPDFPSVKSWHPGSEAKGRVGKDEHGRVVAIQLPDGRVIRQDFTKDAKIARQKTSAGDVVVIGRDATGNVEKLEERGTTSLLLKHPSGAVAGSITARSSAEVVRSVYISGDAKWRGYIADPRSPA